MHRQAHDVLPALLAHLGVAAPPWLFGHSDGGSIALLFAAAHPARVAGVVAVAPHVFVEDVAVRSIDATRTTYLTTDLRARLARYHDDPDSAFWGWNDIWLDPAFRAWNIEDALPAHRVSGARRAGRGRRVRHDGAGRPHRARACRRRASSSCPPAGTRRTATSRRR